MKILKDQSLKDYSTMRLGGRASFLSIIESEKDLLDSLDFAEENQLETLMVGSGSNIIWKEEGYKGLLLVNRIKGKKISGNRFICCSGEIWDDAVDFTVEHDLSGLECMSLIPGTAGATPVQNVGAYGQEVSDRIESIRAYDKQKRTFVALANGDCGFAYRDSIFRRSPGRYFLTEITFILEKEHLSPPFYSALQDYLNQKKINDYTPASLRRAVINIRSAKLPDPAVVANCGSFFKNPIISIDAYERIKQDYKEEEIPAWAHGNGFKVSAAWLLNEAGFKDAHDKKSGMGTWPSQTLVLINEKAESSRDLMNFKTTIEKKVKKKFNIELEMEPLLLP